MIILTEVKWNHCPSFHYYITTPYVTVTRTCCFRDFYVLKKVIFSQRLFIRFSAWVWTKIGYYGREK